VEIWERTYNIYTDSTATYENMKSVPRRTERTGHELYAGDFPSSPDLIDDLDVSDVGCCGVVMTKS
jgi:hypothetical protein